MKFTGRYTAATAKALKGSPRLVCQVTEDGTIYVCNGFLLCTMNPPEYAATVQGFTCCEPGNWTLDKDGKHEDDAHKLDLVRLYADTLKANADAQPLQRSPLTVQTPIFRGYITKKSVKSYDSTLFYWCTSRDSNPGPTD